MRGPELPCLRDGGGFQFLKGVPNSRSLEPSKASLKVLKQREGQGRTYIRPIRVQSELSKHIFGISQCNSLSLQAGHRSFLHMCDCIFIGTPNSTVIVLLLY